MNILSIDTSNNKQVMVGLKINNETDMLTRMSDQWKSQAVLPLIDELLKKYKLTLQELTAIEVHEGPGSFTGLRVGVAIANTLGTWLKIPINKKNVGEKVLPRYQ